MNFNDKQIQAPHPPFPVDHVHPWHKGSKVGSREMDIAVMSPGIPGAHADFGTPTASVDNTTGTPSVEVTSSGPFDAKVFNFAFHNLKGEPFEFEDFTESQLDNLRDGINAVYSLVFANTTTSTATGVIDIPITSANYNPEFDILLVFANGLLVSPNEYSIIDHTNEYGGKAISYSSDYIPTHSGIAYTFIVFHSSVEV